MNRFIIFAILLMLLSGCSQISDEMIFTGSVESDEVDVSPEVSGIIEEIYVDDGSEITKGEQLLRLNTEDYELKLEILKNAKAMAELNYKDLNDGNSENQVKSAKASVRNLDELINGSEVEISYLINDYNQAKSLFDAGATSKNVLDQAKRLLDREEAKLRSLRQQKEVYLAQLDLVLEGASTEAVDAADLLVKQKELEIEDLVRQISKSKVTSPVTGYVQTVNYNVGEWVAIGSKTVSIIDSSKLWIKIYVPEKLLYKVSLGQSISLLDEFIKDKEIKGEVVYISSKAEFTPKNIESKENKQEMVYEVRVEIDDKSDTIKPGMFLDVKLAGE